MITPKRALVTFIIFITIPCGFTNADEQCGKVITRRQKGKLIGKVVGGYDVGYYKYPWFALLQIDDETLCGGALIAPNLVLTAAHCFQPFTNHGRKAEDVFMVKLGVYKQCEKEPTQSVYKTIKVDIHDMYKDNKPYYDIALLKLDGDTSQYSPICLPNKPLNDQDQDQEAKIIGFGSTVNEGSIYPCEMREGRILIYDNITCINMVKTHTSIAKETAFINVICAGYLAGGVDSCAGDSGGPVMTRDPQTNTWTTVGITSFGWGCGNKNSMGIYTDVSKYLDWIHDKSGIHVTDNQNDDTYQAESPSSVSDDFVDTFSKYWDQMINSKKQAGEIVIRFGNN